MGILSMLGRGARRGVSRTAMDAEMAAPDAMAGMGARRAEDVMAPGLMGAGLPPNQPQATDTMQQVFQALHEMPGAPDEAIAQALSLPVSMVKIARNQLDRAGFDTMNRGYPGMSGY